MTEREAMILGRLAHFVDEYAADQYHGEMDDFEKGYVAGLVKASQMIVDFNVDSF